MGVSPAETEQGDDSISSVSLNCGDSADTSMADTSDFEVASDTESEGQSFTISVCAEEDSESSDVQIKVYNQCPYNQCRWDPPHSF